jgi:hypothetical protein
MMGLVAERMAYIATTGISRNGSSQTYLDAAVYCHNGILAVENYNTVPVSGRFNLIGGATMKGATVFGTFSGSTLVSGMLRTLRYDSRFLSQSPPSFPFANKCELVSWWEN